jgi:hypothetical protein
VVYPGNKCSQVGNVPSKDVKGKSKVTQICQSPAVARTVPRFSTSNPSGERGADSKSDASQSNTVEAPRHNNIIHAFVSILPCSLYTRSVNVLLTLDLVLRMVLPVFVMDNDGEVHLLAWAHGLPVVE